MTDTVAATSGAMQRLTREDARILALEDGPIAGHVCKVLVIGPSPAGERLQVAGLRAAVTARLDREPLLRTRLQASRVPRRLPAWVPDEDFDPARHIRSADAGGEPLDEAGLQAVVAGLMAQRLDRDHPLWTMDLAPLRNGGAAVIWRIHHCLADGAATLRIGGNVLWEAAEPDVGRIPSSISSKSAPPVRGQDRLRQMPLLPGTLRREVATRSARSRLAGTVGRRRAVAWADADFDGLHRGAKALVEDATVNDAVLAVVAGALRDWLGEEGHGLRVKVPVSLHGAGDHASNRDSFLFVDLPLAEPGPAERLASVRLETAERKRAHDAERLDLLLGDLGRLPGGRRALKLVSGPGAFALNVSNVRGPVGATRVAGHPVVAMHALAEVAPAHALRVAVVTALGSLSFGLCADAEVVPDLAGFAGALQREAGAIEAAAG